MFSGKKSLGVCLISGWIALAAGVSQAQASITLKQVQAVEGDRVEVVFDGRIQKSQVRTEVMGDVLQLTVQDADVYPAKISNLSGHSVRKVFAYQYAPRVVRVRMTLRNPSEPFQLSASGKTLSVVVKNEAVKDAVRSSSASPSMSANDTTEDEAKLAARVSDSSGVATAVTPSTKHSKKESADTSRSAQGEDKTPIAGGKNVGNPLAAFGKLMAVLVLFLAIALGARKLLSRRAGLANRLGKWSGLKAKGPIEVIATHYLGPKKSIAVVRVGGRELVLGITDEAINLITQMHQSVEDEMEAQQESRTSVQGGTQIATANAFESALTEAASAPKSANAAKNSTVRSQIRSRLEGMKQL